MILAQDATLITNGSRSCTFVSSDNPNFNTGVNKLLYTFENLLLHFVGHANRPNQI